MTIARRQQISLDQTPYYHCTTRCVRRAFLCGTDQVSGQNFDHRKQWLEDRLVELAQVFAIDLLAYAIMSNHYHVVVRINPAEAADWPDDEVIKRWGRLFSVEQVIGPELIEQWRERLCSLSWYMRCINEPLARRSNREDSCTGRFWEGRFHCQALLDEGALIRCMAYVDLNPVRAGVASTPEASAHTSVRARIRATDGHLLAFAGTDTASGIPFRRCDYLELLDWTGRQWRADKRGRIPPALAPILQRLDTESGQWLAQMRHYGRWYYRAVGSIQALEQYAHRLGQRWLKGRGHPVPALT